MTEILKKAERSIERLLDKSQFYQALQTIKAAERRSQDSTTISQRVDFLLRYVRQFAEAQETESAIDLAISVLNQVNSPEISTERTITIMKEILKSMRFSFAKWQQVLDKMFEISNTEEEKTILAFLSDYLPIQAIKAGAPELALKYSKSISGHIALSKFISTYSRTLLCRNEVDLFILQFTLSTIVKKGVSFANDFFICLMVENPDTKESKAFPFNNPAYNFVYLIIKSISDNSKDQFKILVEAYEPTWSLDSYNKEIINKISGKFFQTDSSNASSDSSIFNNIFNTVRSMFSQPSNTASSQNQPPSNQTTHQTQSSTNTRTGNDNDDILDLD